MKNALEEGLEEKFKIVKPMATSNLVAFDAQGRITKYANVEAMLQAFFDVRIKFYEKRKVSIHGSQRMKRADLNRPTN